MSFEVSSVESISTKTPNLVEALIPIVFMMISLVVGIFMWDVSPHIPLLLSVCVAILVAMRLGFKWKAIETGMLDAIRLALQAIVILIVIGTIIASWIAGGIVPTLIYYGLNLLNPAYFLVAACAICCIISIASGNAWTAAGTIGIAIMGIGLGLFIISVYISLTVFSAMFFQTTGATIGVLLAVLFGGSFIIGLVLGFSVVSTFPSWLELVLKIFPTTNSIWLMSFQLDLKGVLFTVISSLLYVIGLNLLGIYLFTNKDIK